MTEPAEYAAPDEAHEEEPPMDADPADYADQLREAAPDDEDSEYG